MTSHLKVAVVTASYSGIGFELSRQLLRKGFQLAVLNRDANKTRHMIQHIKQEFPSAQIHSYTADLADHQAIRHACEKIAADFPEIDALFNNAGVLLPELRYSPQGNEMHFEINTVAPFMLMHLLKPQLANAQNAAVVTSGSGARRMARVLDVAQLKQPQSFKKMSGPYAQSKLAISTACAALEQEFGNAGIRLKVVDINPTKTQMAASDGMPGWIKPFKFLFASPEKTAQRLMDAAFGPQTPTPSDLPSAAIQQQLLELLYTTSGLRLGQHAPTPRMGTTPHLSAANN
jgi:NAD(P)-dependent dehydrogenase (short-subunit alcohol dehydrogenase family)